jgi:archaellum component FlaC
MDQHQQELVKRVDEVIGALDGTSQDEEIMAWTEGRKARKKLDARGFARVDEWIEQLEGRQDEVLVRMDSADESLERMDAQLVALDGRFDVVDRRLVGFRTWTTSADDKLDRLQKQGDAVQRQGVDIEHLARDTYDWSSTQHLWQQSVDRRFAQLDGWRGEMDAWRGEVDRRFAQLDGWRGEMDAWRGEVDRRLDRIDAWRRDVDVWRRDVDVWRSGVDEKLAVIDERLAVVDERLAVVDSKLTVVDEKLAVVDSKLTVVDDKLAAVLAAVGAAGGSEATA